MIKIGIIDSGINPQAGQEGTVIEGLFLLKDALSSQIRWHPDLSDHIGHGTECFKIISSIVTGASYYVVKIFDQEMVAEVDVLAAAIRACIAQQVNIINISAGVRADQVPPVLREVFDEAYAHQVTIISANHNAGSQCYPAHDSKVIGVGLAQLTTGELYTYKKNENIEFYTSAADLYTAEVVWSNATSFACAKMTAYAANILKRKGKMKMEQLKTELVNYIQTK